MIHNTLRQWYGGLEIAPPLLKQDTPTVHIQSTPQQTDGWTCGLHMLLVNLTTIYQGRIPTLTHTQYHAESLSRSHLKYILARELDTYVTKLIHDLTNPTQRSPNTYRTHRHKRAQPTPNTDHGNTSPLSTTILSRKKNTPYHRHPDPPPIHSLRRNPKDN